METSAGLSWLGSVSGRFENMLIGPDEERWDLSFVAEYPNLAAFNEILRDPVYRDSGHASESRCRGFPADPPGRAAAGHQVRAVSLELNVMTDASRATSFAKDWSRRGTPMISIASCLTTQPASSCYRRSLKNASGWSRGGRRDV